MQLRRVIPASQCLVSLISNDDSATVLHAEDHAQGVVAPDARALERNALALDVQQSGRLMRLDRTGLLAQAAKEGKDGQDAGNGWLAVPLVGRDGAKLGLA
jgi:hypothetical protein